MITNEVHVVFDKKVASVYNEMGDLINRGNRDVDRAFARNVCKANGYTPEEVLDGHVRTVILRRT